jgi:hypothetical protein
MIFDYSPAGSESCWRCHGGLTALVWSWTQPEYIPFELPGIRTFKSLLSELTTPSAVRLSLRDTLEQFNHGQSSWCVPSITRARSTSCQTRESVQPVLLSQSLRRQDPASTRKPELHNWCHVFHSAARYKVAGAAWTYYPRSSKARGNADQPDFEVIEGQGALVWYHGLHGMRDQLNFSDTGLFASRSHGMSDRLYCAGKICTGAGSSFPRRALLYYHERSLIVNLC